MRQKRFIIAIMRILDKLGIAKRDELKDYEGHGNYSAERGWWLFGRWISRDK